MAAIYAPKGKALEYSPLALNLYKGCSHGCSYCYVPGIPPYKFVKNAREAFYSNPAPRVGILREVERDARKLSGDKRPVLMSFTSDPYQPCEQEHGITRQAIEILGMNSLQPQILTKGGLWAVDRDAEILVKSRCIWAATLTCDNDAKSLEWEPGASLPGDRIEALKKAKSLGLTTWVSLEPVIDPEAAIRIIHATHNFVDLFKVGKLNHHPHEHTINWTRFLNEAEKALDRHNCNRYIKVDLEKFRG